MKCNYCTHPMDKPCVVRKTDKGTFEYCCTNCAIKGNDIDYECHVEEWEGIKIGDKAVWRFPGKSDIIFFIIDAIRLYPTPRFWNQAEGCYFSASNCKILN